VSFNFELLLVFLIAVAGYFAIRALLAPDERTAEDIYAESRQRDRQTFGTRATGDKNQPAPVSNDLGRVRVMEFNFAHFDAVPGPPDPENFADELIVELYDPISDFRWTSTYVIATPAGIRNLMDEERWNFFYATEIFIVRRYDLQVIREAVYGRIKEVHDQVPLDAEEPPIRG
jgi:hypothetical protein